MESWLRNVWLRRVVPVVLLGAGVLMWYGWHRWERNRAEAERERLALATARIWVASAELRDQPERFVAYRDSLLAAEEITRGEVMAYLYDFRADPHAISPFTERIKRLIDSLVASPDRVPANRRPPADSTH